MNANEKLEAKLNTMDVWGFFLCETKEPGFLPIFLVRSCQDLLEHKSWLLYSAQNLCIIVLNSSFHSASDQTKITFVYGWYISSSFSFFFAASNLCSSHKSRARYFCKKNCCNFFFQTKSFVFGCGQVSAWDLQLSNLSNLRWNYFLMGVAEARRVEELQYYHV